MAHLHKLHREAQDRVRIIEKAMDAERAAKWLRDYGLSYGRDKDAGSVSVSLGFASCCSGSKEAKVYLDKAAQDALAKIVIDAIHAAEADILAAQGIEAGTAETGTGSVHESPVGSADAPTPDQGTPNHD